MLYKVTNYIEQALNGELVMGKFAELAAKLEDIERHYPNAVLNDVDLEYGQVFIEINIKHDKALMPVKDWYFTEPEIYYLSGLCGIALKDIITIKNVMCGDSNERINQSKRIDTSKEI